MCGCLLWSATDFELLLTRERTFVFHRGIIDESRKILPIKISCMVNTSTHMCKINQKLNFKGIVLHKFPIKSVVNRTEFVDAAHEQIEKINKIYTRKKKVALKSKVKPVNIHFHILPSKRDEN